MGFTIFLVNFAEKIMEIQKMTAIYRQIDEFVDDSGQR